MADPNLLNTPTKITVLSDKDLALLRAMVREWLRMDGNRPIYREDDRPFPSAPTVVVRTPSGGIPARSGTNVSSDECTIYQNIDGTLIASDASPIVVNNLSTVAAAGASYYIANKDGFGKWWLQNTELDIGLIADTTLSRLCVVKSGGNVTDNKYLAGDRSCAVVPECTDLICPPDNTIVCDCSCIPEGAALWYLVTLPALFGSACCDEWSGMPINIVQDPLVLGTCVWGPPYVGHAHYGERPYLVNTLSAECESAALEVFLSCDGTDVTLEITIGSPGAWTMSGTIPLASFDWTGTNTFTMNFTSPFDPGEPLPGECLTDGIEVTVQPSGAIVGTCP